MISKDIIDLINILEQSSISDTADKTIDLGADMANAVTERARETAKDHKGKLAIAGAVYALSKPGVRKAVTDTVGGTYHFLKRGFGYGS
jgi:hypothetical protein